MATFGSTIEEARRILMPRPPQSVALSDDYTAGATSITLDYTNPMFVAVRPGAVLSVDLELMYVLSVDTSTGVTTVSPGAYGSSEANHTAGVLVEIGPRFSRFEVSNFINEELLALSSPTVGLGQILRTEPTFIPVFMGYDLGDNFDSLRSRVLEVSFRIAPPIRTYPLIRRGQYRVIRNQDPTQSDFPSGNGLIIYRNAWPGFPITIQFTAPYGQLVNLTDDLNSVAGVQTTAEDIVYMGTVLRAAPDREIARNSMEWQPDPRKAPEVPPGGMRTSTDGPSGLYLRYMRRISEEKSYFRRAYPNAEWN